MPEETISLVDGCTSQSISIGFGESETRSDTASVGVIIGVLRCKALILKPEIKNKRFFKYNKKSNSMVYHRSLLGSTQTD